MLLKVTSMPPSSTDDLEVAFMQLQQSLRNYLRKRVPDVSLADDLLQDIFVKALQSRQSGQQIDNLSGWLYAVARTTLADHLRIKGIETAQLNDNLPEDETEDLQLHQEISSCLKPFIEDLSPVYRDTLIATGIEGETHSAYAKKLGVSTSAIKSRVVRGRAMLKDKLLSCCDIDLKDGLVNDFHCKSQNCCDNDSQ